MGRGEKARSDLAATTLTCLNSNLSTSIDKVSEKDEERKRERKTGDMPVQVHVDKDLNSSSYLGNYLSNRSRKRTD